MNDLRWILRQLLSLLRPSQPVAPVILPSAFRPAEPPPVETPPPDTSDCIQVTGQEEMYSIYVAEGQWGFLLQQSASCISKTTDFATMSAGANNEYQAFWEWAASKPSRSLLRQKAIYSLYFVQNAFVLEIYGFRDNLQRYYCTLLDLPEGRFTLLDWIYRDPKEHEAEARFARQHALDCSHSRKGK